jgi:glycogen debranching enzyme
LIGAEAMTHMPMPSRTMNGSCVYSFVFMLVGFFLHANATAQSQSIAINSPVDSMQIAAPFKSGTQGLPSERFVAAHGQRGFIAGYATKGLEAWVYPFQIFKDYRVSFQHAGSADSIDGATLLKQIEYRPESITRVYQGADYTVREKLFVPLDSPGGLIIYSVESKSPLQIGIHITPVLGLMWPAEVGPATAEWDQALKSISLMELAHGYRAIITAPESRAHSLSVSPNPTPLANQDLQLTLAPDSNGEAIIAWSLSPHLDDGVIHEEILNTPDQSATPPIQADNSPGYTATTLRTATQRLIDEDLALESASAMYYRSEQENHLQIETPDPAVNQAIRWSGIALEQAWACNPDLGCGFVAGYGPSRIERRPQYAWFFAGDGMVSAEGLLSVGDFKRVREELDFILRYQDKKTGMIWHELTQSAPFIDWAGKYPYFYAHVDTTLQFLSFVDRYVEQSGDIEFLKQNWPAIQAAYRYASSLINSKTGLPQIPADKEGGNEQSKLIDDLGLSTAWIDAGASFAHLARMMKDSAAANQSEAASERARAQIATHYWDNANSFWISGHTLAGTTFEEQHSSPTGAIDLHLFTPDAEDKILNRIASPDFFTAWGIRSVAANSPGYSPTAYAQGSVWPVGTAAWAQTYWSLHRPATAYALWRSLIPLFTLDSAGHLHEVFEGDALRPQTESVPEQSWSSAAFLSATVHGLLGIEVQPFKNLLSFAPHLPEEWKQLSIRHLAFGEHLINLQLLRAGNELTVKIENSGPAFQLLFNPELPIGVHVTDATLDQKKMECSTEDFAQSTVAHFPLEIPAGRSEVQIHYSKAK